MHSPTISEILDERNQSHAVRKKLILVLERNLKRPVFTFFTSFVYPVMVDDSDADMLEGLLTKADLSRGFALFINSPGGSGLAAERILNICRKYSGTKEYWTIVAGKAKSAATMICFGASKIMMGPASELGPVDTQITKTENGEQKRFSVYHLIQSYEDLFQRAVKAQGNLQPYLQQLAHYDEREIREMRSALELSEDIAIKALQTGMMNGEKPVDIKKKIQIFLTPEQTKTHGRPIYADETGKCGLTVELLAADEKLWQLIHRLYARTNHLVSTGASKCIESATQSFTVPAK